MQQPIIRSYEEKDQLELIQLIRLNTPTYFATEEEADFIHYLEKEREDYFVIALQQQVIGCGGINYSSDKKTAIISWGILHPDFQGKGLGKQLLAFRLAHIKNQHILSVVVRTSQVAFLFYQKQGFAITETIKDYWAKGLDLVKMEMVVR